ncbi:MAG: carcinine hydrolase/isopenicillin-N N-acyltransferase family protein [Candidatus Electryoneaceae bacterium]|nr:carcinine hydrolase/isopenicillin-N N-acyltransferase family protein [Candidatus Electryoneaceae bacterium]
MQTTITKTPRLPILFGCLIIALALMAVLAPKANHSELTVLTQFSEAEFWREMNECTTGLASGHATPDGKPLLWKNRDLGGGTQQEYHYVSDGRIPFIGQTYTNRTTQYYGGINAVGFALENSNSYNLDDLIMGGDDDGDIIYLALATCRTVDDFEAILDSTNYAGRTLPSNYGAFDAFGGAAMFETATFRYHRIDAVETPSGFIVRSNYSYSGTGLNGQYDQRGYDWGPNRHDRGYELWNIAAEEGRLTAQYVFQQVIRDLKMPNMDNYSIPYDGYVLDYPYGCIPNSETICRLTSRSIMIAQGVRPNERPDDGILWVMCGSQLGVITVPLWVRAGSVPVEIDGVGRSSICQRGLDIREWTYGEGDGAVNTWRLRNPEGTGFWDWAIPLENWVFDKVNRFLTSPQFHYDRLEAFQNEIAEQVNDSLEAWHPPTNVTEVAEPIFIDNNLILAWGELQFDAFGRDREPQRYAVYRSDQPFREGHRGELVATVNNTRFVDDDPLSGSAFYRVEAIF